MSVGLFAVLATTAFVGVNPALAAAPTLTVPDRVYPDTGQIMDFSGTDPISGDNRALQVSGLTIGNDGCDPKAANNYDVHDCARIQMSLATSEAGLLRLPDNTAITNLDASPDVDVIVNSTGAVVEATDSHGLDSLQFNFNGTPTQIADTLAKIQFIPCAQQQGTAAVSPPPGASPVEVDCGETGGVPANEPTYEEKDTLDGALPTLSIQAINPDAGGSTNVLQIKIKVEGQNAGPVMSAPPGSIDVPASATSDVDGQVDVVDPEMCNFTICGNPYTDPGLKEGDDQMLLVVWIPESMNDTSVCGTFSLRGGAFTSTGGGSLTSVHTLLTDVGGAALRSDQAAAIEATFSPAAQLLDLSTQSGGPLGTNRVFAGIASLDDVKYSLSQIDYNAPAADATCHLNVAVNDLGNNGMPIAYVGSQIGGAENPHPGYEVPDAKGAATSLTFNVQDGHPDVTISQILPSQLGDPAGPNKPSGFRITFSSAVDAASFDASDLSLSTSTASGAALGLLVTVTPGIEYTVPVTATGDGKITLTMSAGAACAAGHFSGSCDSGFDSSAPTLDDNEITWDQTGPTVTIEQKLGQGDPTSTSPITFEVKFSDTISTAPIGFDASDVSFTGSTAGGSLAANVTQPDLLDLKTYNVTVTGMTTDGAVVASVLPNAIVDTALNGSDASTSLDNSVTWQAPVVDNTPPSVTINQGASQLDPTTGSPVVFDVVFSEPVTGFATGDVTVSGSAGATTATVVASANPAVYTVNVTGMTVSGTVTAAISAGAAQDAAANASLASSSTDNTVQWNVPPVDNTPPSVTINQGASQVDPTNASPVVFDVLFSEPVTGFATGDVTLSGSAGATTATVVASANPAVYTVNVTGMTVSGTVTASISAGVAQDAAANASLASSSTDNTVQWNVPPVDNTPPSVTINQGASQVDPTTASPVVFDVVFSEPVTGFATGDVTLSGSAGATTATVVPTANAAIYTVNVTGMTVSGTVTAAISAGAAQDAAANASLASSSTDNTVQWNVPPVDNTPPSVTINQGASQVDPTTASPVVFDVVFSEPVTGFATGDVTLSGSAGATTATVVPTANAAIYTVNVTGMSVSGTVTAAISAGVAQDAAANASLASSSTDNTVQWNVPPVDNTPPTVTINQAAGQIDPATAAPIVFTVIYSEPVNDFANGDVTLGGTAGATTATVSQPNPADFTVYQVDVTGMITNGTVVASIAAGAAHDAANNPSTASTSADNQVTFTLTLAVSTPGGTVTATVMSGCQLTTLTSAAPQVQPPANVTLPYGQLSFSATCAPNALVSFQLTLPSSVNAYYKLIANTWQSFTYDGETGAQFNGNVVTVTIRDNGRGDSDPALGQVSDPGAPAIRATIPATGSNTEPLLWLAVAAVCSGFVMLRTSRRRIPVRVR